MSLHDAERVESVLISPALFLKACAFLVEAADRFETMYRHEEIALNELFLRLCADGAESLPTIHRCYDSFLVKGELIDLGPHHWRRHDVNYLRTMLQKFKEQKLTGLGATPDGQPLKICGVFTDRQRLDALCPPTIAEAADPGPIERAMICNILNRAFPNANGNFSKPWIPENVLETKAIEGWKAECETQGRMDLIGYLAKDAKGIRDKIRRAVVRKR
jgi:hypothetical protein